MQTTETARLIGGRYRPLNVLGEGGMGCVYRAIDLKTSGVITLKTVKASLQEIGIASRSGLDGSLGNPTGETAEPIDRDAETRALPDLAGDEPTRPPSGGLGGEPPRPPSGSQGDEPTRAPSGEMARPDSLDDDERPTIVPQSSSTTMAQASARSTALRLALAREFELLSSLRHPNIISVMDYGFDEVGQPYFTMQLVENGLPFDEAAADRPFPVKVELLARLFPDIDLDDWLDEVHAIALVDSQDGRARFAHDKLREGLLEEIGPEQRRDNHGTVAEALEAMYGDEVEYFPQLAWHWGQFGDTERECRYSIQAAVHALGNGACDTAIEQFSRVAEVMPEPGIEVPVGPGRTEGPVIWTLADVEAQLAEASFQLGKMDDLREHGTRALQLYGQPMPGGMLFWILGLWWQIGVKIMQGVMPGPFRVTDPQKRRLRYEAMKVQQRMSELFIYGEQPINLMWSGFKVVNLGNPLGDSPELARGYSLMTILVGSVPLHGLATKWADHALQIAERAGSQTASAAVCIGRACYHLGTAAWDVLEPEMRSSMTTCRETRDGRHLEETMVCLAKGLHYQGRLDEGSALSEELMETAAERGDQQTHGWGLIVLTECRVRQGRTEDVIGRFAELEEWIDTKAQPNE